VCSRECSIEAAITRGRALGNLLGFNMYLTVDATVKSLGSNVMNIDRERERQLQNERQKEEFRRWNQMVDDHQLKMHRQLQQQRTSFSNSSEASHPLFRFFLKTIFIVSISLWIAWQFTPNDLRDAIASAFHVFIVFLFSKIFANLLVIHRFANAILVTLLFPVFLYFYSWLRYGEYSLEKLFYSFPESLPSTVYIILFAVLFAAGLVNLLVQVRRGNSMRNAIVGALIVGVVEGLFVYNGLYHEICFDDPLAKYLCS
jgi:hypothetical protein